MTSPQTLSALEPPEVDVASARWCEAWKSDTPRFFVQVQRECGDVVKVRQGTLIWYVVSHPDAAQELLKRSNRDIRKGRNWDNFRQLAGQGLVTVEPEQWLAQRRAVQPSFARDIHERFAGRVMQTVNESLPSWCEFARRGEPVLIEREMRRLTLCSAGHNLFGVELSDRAALIGDTMRSVVSYLNLWHTIHRSSAAWADGCREPVMRAFAVR